MPDPIMDLTDKEKEALRLLLAGHDAKSAALELDISVHALNDRLRSARRKLGVTTSKEAARALAEAESADPQTAAQANPRITPQTPPQSLAHKPLGVRQTGENQDSPVIAHRSEGGLLSFAARRKGLLIMTFIAVLSLTAAVAFFPSQSDEANNAAVASDQSFTAETEFVAQRPSDAELQARRWLGLIDFGKFDESYEEAGDPLRDQYSLNKWKFGLTLRMTKGKVEDRTLSTVMRTNEFGANKGGDFEILTFASMFEYNNLQSERVVLQRVGSDWRVIDYEILPVENRLK